MAVLQRKELEASPLADLHAIASELGLEGFRTLRKPELIGAILDAQGGEPEPEAEEVEPDEVPSEEALEAGEEPVEAGKAAPEAGEEDTPPEALEEEAPAEALEDEAPPEELEEEELPEELVSGVLDILPNGSGFMRVDPAGQSRDDVYVSPAQIRRCELRAGDTLSGPVRPPRRNERHPSLVRVATVNGGDAEPPEVRPHFAELTPVFASERLPAPAALEGVPFGKGSRVAIGGPPGAGASRLLRELADVLRGRQPELELAVALVGVRPEEVGDWRREDGPPVYGGSFDRSPEAQAQAADLAVERVKRTVERGGDAVLLVDSLEALPTGAARRVFGAGRKLDEGGSVTVVAVVGTLKEPLRWATTRVLLDPPGEDGRPVVSASSGTLRADLLG